MSASWSRATSSRSFVCTYNGAGSLPRRAASRRSPPIRSSRSPRSRPRAAPSRSNGPATTDFPRPSPPPSPSNETRALCKLAAPWCGRRDAVAPVSESPAGRAPQDDGRAIARWRPWLLLPGAPPSPPKSRSPSASPATTSWAARRARCRTTTPPIPACCGCSTARRCGTARPATAKNPAPTATATRAPA